MAVARLGDVRPQPFTAPGSTTVEANAGTNLTVFAQTAGEAPGGAVLVAALVVGVIAVVVRPQPPAPV